VFKQHGGAFLEWFPQGLITSLDLGGKLVLDLGCGHGGKTVYYAVSTSPKLAVGVDIDFSFVREGLKFAHFEGVWTASFTQARAEALPFASQRFDSIFSHDVFEHVDNLDWTLQECYRLLKPDGKLFAVFPPYFHPFGAHLHYTKLPCLHWFFPTELIYEVIREQYGTNFRLQIINGRTLREGLNGMTVREFNAIMAHSPFKVNYRCLAPFFSPASSMGKRIRPRLLSGIVVLLQILANLPLMQEYFTHRIVVVLQRI
jgi:SAM-dependent methyltransferase